jgi:hypothetical protein
MSSITEGLIVFVNYTIFVINIVDWYICKIILLLKVFHVRYAKYILMTLYIVCSLKCLSWELNDTDLWRELKKKYKVSYENYLFKILRTKRIQGHCII